MSYPFDVFISYNWDHKAQVRRLYDELTTTYKLKCWLDDIELKPGALMDELSKGINDSKVFLCCITKAYCKSQNCIGEINHARNTDKPMVILMLERLRVDTLGGVGFIIGPMIRINAYKFSELFDEPTGDLFKQVISAVNARLDEWRIRNNDTQQVGQAGFQEMEFVRSLNSHSASVLCLCELTKNRLASGGADNIIVIWNLTEFTKIIELKGHTDLVTCLKALPENRLASGSMDTNIIIWNTSSYEAIKTLKGHSEGITCLKVLPDKELCSGSNDYSMRVWNLKTYECIKEIRGQVKRHVQLFKSTKKKAERMLGNSFLRRSSSSSLSSTSSQSGVTSNATLTTDPSLGPGDSSLEKVPIDEKTESLAPSAEKTESLALSVEKESLEPDTTLSDRTNTLKNTVSRSSTGEYTSSLVADKESRRISDGTRSITDSDDGKKKSKQRFLPKKRLLKFIKAKDRESMDSGMTNETESTIPNDEVIDDDVATRVHDEAIQEENEDFQENEAENDKNEEEEEVEEEEGDQKNKKKKKALNEKVNSKDGHTKAVYCLKNIKAPNEITERTRFASGSGDKLIKIWDLINYNCLNTLKGHGSFIICLKNLTKNRLASGSADKSIIIWDLVKYTALRTLNGHTADIQCLQTLSDNRLASGSCDTTIRIWNVNTDKNDKKKYECIKVLKEHTKYVSILKKYRTDRLISSSNDNIIKVWNLKTYEKVEDFKEHSKWISSILPLGNGRVSSCSWDQTIKVWKPKEV